MRSMTTSDWKVWRYSAAMAAMRTTACGVFGVDVEDGDGEALGEVGGEARGVGFAGEGGEAEQVVDDDLDGPADVVAVQGGEVEALGPDALAGEGGVAVDDHGEDLAAGFEEVFLGAVAGEAFLVGAGAAHDDGVGGFEMAGVGGEVEVDGFAGGGDEVAGCAHVVFDVAAAEGAAGVNVFELGEDIARRRGRSVLTMTLRRPRWLMAKMERLTPSSAAVVKS